jgi:hypothetical protein
MVGDFDLKQWLVGNSELMEKLRERVVEVARSGPKTILIVGETGTGKDVVANLMHKLSDRNARPFVHVNCGAIPEGFDEATLFGYMRGAFTGAVKDTPGVFEQADKGTLFLNEITNGNEKFQAALLTVIETGTLRRMGGTKNISVDVRVIAATNLDPDQAVRDGKLRQDLRNRFKSEIKTPPLRDHREDIDDIALHLCLKERLRLKPADISDALAECRGESWKDTNVRGLIKFLSNWSPRQATSASAPPPLSEQPAPAPGRPVPAPPAERFRAFLQDLGAQGKGGPDQLGRIVLRLARTHFADLSSADASRGPRLRSTKDVARQIPKLWRECGWSSGPDDVGSAELAVVARELQGLGLGLGLLYQALSASDTEEELVRYKLRDALLALTQRDPYLIHVALRLPQVVADVRRVLRSPEEDRGPDPQQRQGEVDNYWRANFRVAASHGVLIQRIFIANRPLEDPRDDGFDTRMREIILAHFVVGWLLQCRHLARGLPAASYAHRIQIGYINAEGRKRLSEPTLQEMSWRPEFGFLHLDTTEDTRVVLHRIGAGPRGDMEAYVLRGRALSSLIEDDFWKLWYVAGKLLGPKARLNELPSWLEDAVKQLQAGTLGAPWQFESLEKLVGYWAPDLVADLHAWRWP